MQSADNQTTYQNSVRKQISTDAVFNGKFSPEPHLNNLRNYFLKRKIQGKVDSGVLRIQSGGVEAKVTIHPIPNTHEASLNIASISEPTTRQIRKTLNEYDCRNY